MARYSEKMYIAFVLGYDLLHYEFDKLEFACDEAFEISLGIADWFLNSEYDNPDKSLYDCLQEFIEKYTSVHSHRYEACKGFNTKQWWLYDNDTDEFVDLPHEISRIATRLDFSDSDMAYEFLCRVAGANPAWLEDKYLRFGGDFEI